MKFNRAFAALACAALAVSGCAGEPDAAPTTTAATSPPATVTPSQSPSPSVGQHLKDNSVRTRAIGEEFEIGGVKLTIDTIEEMKSLPTKVGADGYGLIKPAQGHHLWLVVAKMTNLNEDTFSGLCGGPPTVFFSAFDVNGQKMKYEPDSFFIHGNDCDKEVRQGETGGWSFAYESAGNTFGWLQITSFHDEEEFVVLDPSIKVTPKKR